MDREEISKALRMLSSVGCDYNLTEKDRRMFQIAANEIDDLGAYAKMIIKTLKSLI